MGDGVLWMYSSFCVNWWWPVWLTSAGSKACRGGCCLCDCARVTWWCVNWADDVTVSPVGQRAVVELNMPFKPTVNWAVCFQPASCQAFVYGTAERCVEEWFWRTRVIEHDVKLTCTCTDLAAMNVKYCPKNVELALISSPAPNRYWQFVVYTTVAQHTQCSVWGGTVCVCVFAVCVQKPPAWSIGV